MLGAITGDIIGSTHEYDNRIKTKDFELFPEGSTFTDDTVLTVAVADSLLNNIPYPKSFYKWVSKYPNRGYGQRFFQWVISKDKKPYGSKGNGAAMRVSPIGWLFDTEEEVLEEAKRSAEVTHNSKEGVESAQAVAIAIFMARMGKSKKEIKEYITDKFNYDLDKKLDDIRDSYEHSMKAIDSVPEAIICFLESDSFEDAIRNAVSLGGDADTMACITGSIAHAFFSFDVSTLCPKFDSADFKIHKYLSPEINNLFCDFIKGFNFTSWGSDTIPIQRDYDPYFFADRIGIGLSPKRLPKDPVLEGIVKSGDEVIYDNTIFEEDLPSKYVFYPRHRRAFLGFANSRDDIPIFCSCMKPLINAYLISKISEYRKNGYDKYEDFPLDLQHLPYSVRESLDKEFQRDKSDDNLVSFLKFESNLCHVCNKKIPELRYKSHGGKFERMFGWYIAQERWQMMSESIYPMDQVSFDDCPEELKEKINDFSAEGEINLWEEVKKDMSSPKLKILKNLLSNYFEDLVRIRFGYKRVGEAWVTETTLLYMIKNIFPDFTVIHHFRPPELKGLELDIYIKEVKIGVEYQGIQHYQAFEYLGGQEAFEKTKERDKKKAYLCKKNDIKLIYFKHDEEITDALVESRIESAMSV